MKIFLVPLVLSFCLMDSSFSVKAQASDSHGSDSHCLELWAQVNRDRANNLKILRNSLPSGYAISTFNSPSDSYSVLVVEEKGNYSDPKIADQGAWNVATNLDSFDASIFSEDRIPLDDPRVIIDLAAPQSSLRQKLLTLTDGILRFVPLGVLLASPTLFGKTGADLVLSWQFLTTNFGVMFGSWYFFPQLITRVSAKEWQTYYANGETSPGIATLNRGDRIERIQFSAIANELMGKISAEAKATQEHPGKPILSVLVSDRIRPALTDILMQRGYRKIELDSLVDELTK